MNKVPLPLKVHPNIKIALENEAKELDKPLSRHTETILKKHVKKQENKIKSKREYGA